MSIPFGRLGLCFKLFSASFYPRSAKEHLARFIRAVEPAGVVVDLGGGTGTLLDLARTVRPDLTYVCIDPAVGMLRYVGQYGFRVAARGEALPLCDASVGAVAIGDAIHHFADPGAAIAEVHRVLQQNGTLFVFDIDPESLMGRIAVATERFLGEPANFYSPDRIRDLLTTNGFRVREELHRSRYTLEAKKSAARSS